jgi:cytochrome-b5 reductase
MSLFRSVAHVARRHPLHRTFSTAPNSKPNWPLFLSAAGLTGLGLYAYLEWYPKKESRPVQEKSPLDPKDFIDFKLKRIVHYNHNTSKCAFPVFIIRLSLHEALRFIFDLPDQQASLLPIASCVIVKASDPTALLDKKGKPVVRPYTPISPSDQPGELAFLIKRYDSGNASKHIHSLNPGDSLSIKGPISKFDYKRSSPLPPLCLMMFHNPTTSQ